MGALESTKTPSLSRRWFKNMIHLLACVVVVTGILSSSTSMNVGSRNAFAFAADVSQHKGGYNPTEGSLPAPNSNFIKTSNTKKIFCPSFFSTLNDNTKKLLNIRPRAMMLPKRKIEYVNTSVTENGYYYHAYTATYPVVGETVVSFYAMEPCLPEGAAASFNLRTDVYAEIAAASYEDFEKEDNQESKTPKIPSRVWIPRPDNPTVSAYWGIDTFLSIRFNREPFDIVTQSPSKVYCDEIATGSFSDSHNVVKNIQKSGNPKQHQSRIISKYLINPQVISLLHPGLIVPDENALDDLAEQLFSKVINELRVEAQEVANIILSKALRNVSACVAFPVSMDNLFGFQTPHTIQEIPLLTVFHDPMQVDKNNIAFLREKLFVAPNCPQICLRHTQLNEMQVEYINNVAPTTSSNANTPATSILPCFDLSRIVLQNVRVTHAKISSDRLFHIQGNVQMQFEYQYLSNKILQRGGQNQQQSHQKRGYDGGNGDMSSRTELKSVLLNYFDIPFKAVIEPSTGINHINIMYEQGKHLNYQQQQYQNINTGGGQNDLPLTTTTSWNNIPLEHLEKYGFLPLIMTSTTSTTNIDAAAMTDDLHASSSSSSVHLDTLISQMLGDHLIETLRHHDYL